MEDNNIVQDIYNFYGDVRTSIDNSRTTANSDNYKQGMFYALQGFTFCLEKYVNAFGYDNLRGNDGFLNQEEKTVWCDLQELCKRHPELCKSKVKSRQWRIDNDFPCKSGYKCKLIFYEPDVEEWILNHLKREKC